MKSLFRYLPHLVALAAVCGSLSAANAQKDKAPAPDFSKGVFYGKVLDTVTGKPVPDATVALTDKDGKVITWTKTNANGEYALAADCMKCLNLRPSHRRGLLEQVAKAVGDVVMAPVKVAADVVKNPVATAKNVAVSAASGNPLPVAAQVASPIIDPVKDPKAAKDATVQQLKTAAAQTALGEKPAGSDKRDTPGRGEVFLAVTAPNYTDIKGKAGAYWLEPSDAEAKKEPEKGAKPYGLRAWLETAKLAPTSAAGKKSEITQEALLLADPHLEPALVPAGGVLKLNVKLQMPAGDTRRVRLFAREGKKKTAVELTSKDNIQYFGEMRLDPKLPAGSTTITFVALRSEPIEVKLDQKKGDPLLEFVRRLDDLDPEKPYAYDPRIMATENRFDLPCTVLDPKQSTAPTSNATPPDPAGKKTPPPPAEKPATPPAGTPPPPAGTQPPPKDKKG